MENEEPDDGTRVDLQAVMKRSRRPLAGASPMSAEAAMPTLTSDKGMLLVADGMLIMLRFGDAARVCRSDMACIPLESIVRARVADGYLSVRVILPDGRLSRLPRGRGEAERSVFSVPVSSEREAARFTDLLSDLLEPEPVALDVEDMPSARPAWWTDGWMWLSLLLAVTLGLAFLL